jgi:anti-anti-sigma factor
MSSSSKPSAPLAIEAEKVGDDVTIRLSGRLDVNTSPDFRKVAQTLCVKRYCKRLTIDFADVEYIDTSGLATLLETLVMAKGRGAKVTLSGLNEEVRYLIDVNGLKGFFIFGSSEQEKLHL